MTIERFVKIGVKEKTPKSPGGLDLRVSITAPNMAAVESLLGASYLSDLGPVRAKGHITGTTEVPSIENIAITDVLVVLASMPPAVLGAVFLRRYGGDASFASALLLAASLVSCVSIPVVFWFVG